MSSPVESLQLDNLRSENEELRAIVNELRQLLNESSATTPTPGDDGGNNWRRLLEEKAEVIRTQALEIQELKKQVHDRQALPNEQELLTLSDELERERVKLDQERREIDEERRAMQEDIDGMMQQARQMEMTMSKERAYLAQKENKLNQVINELRLAMESELRDGNVRERLSKVQRLMQELSGKGR